MLVVVKSNTVGHVIVLILVHDLCEVIARLTGQAVFCTHATKVANSSLHAAFFGQPGAIINIQTVATNIPSIPHAFQGQISRHFTLYMILLYIPFRRYLISAERLLKSVLPFIFEE